MPVESTYRTYTPPWHTLSAAETCARLGSDATTGLSEGDARARLAETGPNALPEERPDSALVLFVRQFRDVMILVLFAAAIISGLVGDLTDTLVILAIVALNAIAGFVQEYRAERALSALKRLSTPNAAVLRDGGVRVLHAEALVPGDIVLLEAGQAVPADLRLVDATQLRVDESLLTGESHPVEKHIETQRVASLPAHDRRNTAFRGTLVTSGRGRGVVIATGAMTEIGGIARLLQREKEVATPLLKRLGLLGRQLSVAVLLICAILFVVGILRGEPPLLMVLTAVSLAVAAIPEALPAVVTVSLALGARRMVRHSALIRRLPAVETLGSVTYICSDKTGTLTLNRMRAEEIRISGTCHTRGDGAWPTTVVHRALFTALALNNDARREGGGLIVGDPTEIALLDAAHESGLDSSTVRNTLPRVFEIPFTAERARMTTVHALGSGFMVLTKGAPESVLPLCRDVLVEDGIRPIDRQAMAREATVMASQGLRVIAVARRALETLPDAIDDDSLEHGLSFIGFVGLMDPPRPEAASAVAECRAAGITPVMITGDHPATAFSVAQRLDMITRDDELLTGRDLATMSDESLDAVVEHVRVYARVTPEQKIRIVKALQARGEFVAMTGDGVNDAPALRRADIGVAMGQSGTDVAREAAHMVLLDDRFATIVAAVHEGRRIYDNIRKFIKYAMTANSGEIWVLFLAPFLGLPIPLLPIHILWINLVTDGLPGLALAVEPAERGVMHRPPRPPRESVFAQGMWQHIAWVGLLMGAASLVTQAAAIAHGSPHWQTMVFTVLTLSQLGHVLAIRFERDSLFSLGTPANPALVGAVLGTLALQLATLYVPALNAILHTEPLSASELGFCLAMSAVVFFAVEFEKGLIRAGRLYGEAKASPTPTSRAQT